MIVKEENEGNNLKGDAVFPEANIKYDNISQEVNDFLLERDVNASWKLKDGYLIENNISFSFNLGYNV